MPKGVSRAERGKGLQRELREGIHMGIDKQNTIRRALWALGVNSGRVAVKDFYGRALVLVDGRRFGI